MILKNRSTLFLQFQPSIAGLANLFEGASANCFINFEENLSHAHVNFEEKNKVFDPSIVYSSTCSVRCSPYQQVRNMGTQRK
jgi:hypothetical protein